ncbi:tRNA uridine(34) 5-carboxymethylaminomethyl modification radical SAM/GNAT enzyme Elp3 [Candidatus Woesearchaeota archaeon]|nr:tRNA uridine(34) 5-carboxymethylaminomethyl modification radical SAM/GNAT enzyme Elp3 [Candidatus Woesearchaeota archaeon]
MLSYYTEIIAKLKRKKLSSRSLAEFKRKLAWEYQLKEIPTNSQILLHCSPKEFRLLKSKLLSKPIRSLSGVAPVAIMTKPFPCPHGKCIMCPGGVNSAFGSVPQSYTGKEPATMRGLRNDFDPYLQVMNRLEQYVILGHNCEKVELIIMGGTFPSFPRNYQEEFVKYALKAMNDFSELFYPKKRELDYTKFKEFFEFPAEIEDKNRVERIKQKLRGLKNNCSLETEQQKNETSKIRCVALCIETRPDYGLLKEGNEMLRLGCTRVELGIQSVYNEILQRINRGHSTQDAKEAIRTLRDLGFKVAAHYMPGLPDVDLRKDLAGMRQLFSNPDYRPDMLKIYPCLVTKGTKLYEEYKIEKFSPLTADQAAKLIVELKKHVPEYCRIMRIQRDIPTTQIVAGVEMTNLRQYITKKYKVECRCIRCREPQGKKISWKKIRLNVQEYQASRGKEFFISVEDHENDLLVGFVRLRFPSQFLRPEITPTSALIRELHVYGTATGIGEEGSVQHKGWGKKLMKKAEEIAHIKKKDKMVVISGVGAREYYKRLGYNLEGPYLVKKIQSSKTI